MKYKFLAHTADVKFQAFGKTLEKAFENSAFALKEEISGKVIVKEREKKDISVRGKDFESLLYNFLEEILYMLEARDFLFSKVKSIKIDKEKFRLKVIVSGDRASNYKFSNSVKAITYNEMFVKKMKDKWISQVVLDV
jgi:SHS2 domain-containing protein